MLKLESIDHSQTSFWIVDNTFTIGRSTKNQMQVTHDNICDTHAIISKHKDRLFIETAVEEAVISVNYNQISDPTEIKVGDHIALAGVEFKLVDPAVRQPKPNTFTHKEKEIPQQNPIKAKLNQSIWKVQGISGTSSDELHEVNKVIKVGRDPSNDIVVSGSHLSRRHAEFFVNNDQLQVRDLDSSNGTFVNGERIKERSIYLGDEIRFDTAVFRVAVGKAATLLDSSNQDKTQFRAAITSEDLQRAAAYTKEETADMHNVTHASLDSSSMAASVNAQLDELQTPEPSLTSASIVHPELVNDIKLNDASEFKKYMPYMLILVIILVALAAYILI